MAMSPSGRLKVLIRGSTANNEFFGNALLLYPTELPAESGAGLEPATNVVPKAFVLHAAKKGGRLDWQDLRRFRRRESNPQ